MAALERSTSTLDEVDELVGRARAGDVVAFACLFDTFHPRVLGYLAARTGHRSQAEDMASEVFVEVASRIRTFDGDGRAFAAWLFTIARHDLTDVHRAAARRTVVPMADVPDRPADDDTERLVLRRLDAARLRIAVDHLTPDQREVVLLKYAWGASNEETARMLGKPVSAIKSLQHRALARMRRLLTEPGERP